ncbi:hypothetical protein PLICRDRAFT_180104 [Plicaturopsis crispa FD-325 SS-3]|uniref:Uncharacterized protein n=1 Tax=Plicaturopsis crispa FD-325 SS-3 TaxID=944288 RepID=A0A0C9SQH5_PLICR|nr:hypothetical protein PLICRDRAFT_180104 [Plicaturopsis crispa FD-325 SS-3]
MSIGQQRTTLRHLRNLASALLPALSPKAPPETTTATRTRTTPYPWLPTELVAQILAHAWSARLPPSERTALLTTLPLVSRTVCAEFARLAAADVHIPSAAYAQHLLHLLPHSLAHARTLSAEGVRGPAVGALLEAAAADAPSLKAVSVRYAGDLDAVVRLAQLPLQVTEFRAAYAEAGADTMRAVHRRAGPGSAWAAVYVRRSGTERVRDYWQEDVEVDEEGGERLPPGRWSVIP